MKYNEINHGNNNRETESALYEPFNIEKTSIKNKPVVICITGRMWEFTIIQWVKSEVSQAKMG
jgi:hypothetical protein